MESVNYVTSTDWTSLAYDYDTVMYTNQGIYWIWNVILILYVIIGISVALCQVKTLWIKLFCEQYDFIHGAADIQQIIFE